MNFPKSIQRKHFVELDRLSSQTNCCQRNRNSKDPFEGDPFKVQSLNFRYADKPSFYPVSNRGKSFIESDKSQVKHIFYNHDHTIPKCDKENLPHGYSKESHQSINVRKSPSAQSLSVATKACSAEKSISSITPTTQQLKATSQDLGLLGKKNNTFSKGLDSSKSFIGQVTSSLSNTYSNLMLKKRPIKLKTSLQGPDLSESNTDVNANNGGCLITIKINGVPRNQVRIKNNDNIEINLPKLKKMKRSKTLIMSPHTLKTSRSYIIQKNDTASNVGQINVSAPQNECVRKTLEDISTHSMIPHRDERSTLKDSNTIPSAADTVRAYSTLRLNKNLERHAPTLEKILSNNPICVQPKERLLFSRSKTVLGKRSSSSATLTTNTFEKTY